MGLVLYYIRVKKARVLSSYGNIVIVVLSFFGGQEKPRHNMRGNLIGFFILYNSRGMDDRLRIGVLALLPRMFVVICLTSESLRRYIFGYVTLYIENEKGLH